MPGKSGGFVQAISICSEGLSLDDVGCIHVPFELHVDALRVGDAMAVDGGVTLGPGALKRILFFGVEVGLGNLDP